MAPPSFSRFRGHAERHWPLLTALVFFAIYFAVGSLWLNRGLFFCQNTLFHTDVERVTNDMTLWDADHFRATVHPIFPLMLLPFGSFGAKYVQPELACLVLVALAGAGSIAFAAGFLRRLVSDREAFALTLLYAASAANVFMFSIIDTYAFAGLGIAATLYTCRANSALGWKLLTGVFSFGTIFTNLAHVGAAAFFGTRGGFWIRAARGTLLAIACLCLVLGLAYVQSSVMKSGMFFSVKAVGFEPKHYLFPFTGFDSVLMRAYQLVVTFFQHTFVAPTPRFWRMEWFRVDWVSFMNPKTGSLQPYPVLAMPVVAFTSGLLVWATFVNLARNKPQPETWGVILVVGFHALLMLVYGDELFVYTGLWVLHLWAWIALAMASAKRSGHATPGWRILAALAACMLVNNVAEARSIAKHFDGALPCASTDRQCAGKFYRIPQPGKRVRRYY
jgi:hypothetical protein